MPDGATAAERDVSQATATVTRSGRVVRPSVQPLITADFSLVAFLGRDFDVSLFAMTPEARELGGFKEEATGPASADTEVVYLETAKLRLGPVAAAHLATNLLTNLRASNPDIFASAMQPLLDVAPGSAGQTGKDDVDERSDG